MNISAYIRKVCGVLLALVVSQLPLSSCSHDNSGEEDGDGKAVLLISAATLESLSEMSDEEKLHSLRVIILHADGSVEANYHVSDLGGAVKHEHIFKVSGMETKKIYLVANEEGITGVNLDNLGSDPAGTLEKITFTAPSAPTGNPDLISKGIPMSACYELTVGNESRVEKDFFLVRAMTKFTFTFQNIRTDDVSLLDMKVSAFADKSFLFPQFVDDNSAKVGSEQFLVDAVGDYAPLSGRFWIDWLREAVDKSQTGEYTPDEIGWIKNYQLPSGAKHDAGITLDCTGEPKVKALETWTYPKAFYRCESCNGDPQEYRISYLKVKAAKDVSPQEWINKPVLKLNQVRYLFRHTHVDVNIVFGQTEVVIFARIHPWIVIKPTIPLPLEPED